MPEAAPNALVHQALRLKIMAALRVMPIGDKVEFTRLKRLIGATDGNLSRQLTLLAEAGYLAITKDFHNNRPRTRVGLTSDGIAAFDGHIAYLKALISDLQE